MKWEPIDTVQPRPMRPFLVWAEKKRRVGCYMWAPGGGEYKGSFVPWIIDGIEGYPDRQDVTHWSDPPGFWIEQ